MAMDSAVVDVAGDVTRALYGSRKIRLSPAPSQEQYADMLNRVGEYVKRGVPIEAHCIWGGTKCYGKKLYANLAEKTALDRLLRLNGDVKAYYSPGLHTTIMLEDATELTLATSMFHISHYYDSLTKLFKGVECINLCREQELILKQGVSFAEFRQRAIQSGALMRSWWQMGDSIARQKLEEGGWKGVPAWDWYTARAKSELPLAQEATLIARVCMYFGCVLTRRQLGLLDRWKIRFSFCPYPPGVAKELFLGRVEYKLRDGKNSHKCTPPWLL